MNETDFAKYKRIRKEKEAALYQSICEGAVRRVMWAFGVEEDEALFAKIMADDRLVLECIQAVSHPADDEDDA